MIAVRWYRTKFVLALIGLIVLEEATPFVPLCGLVVLSGCFYPRFYLGFCRAMLRYYDTKYGTALAGRIPPHAVIRSHVTAGAAASARQ